MVKAPALGGSNGEETDLYHQVVATTFAEREGGEPLGGYTDQECINKDLGI